MEAIKKKEEIDVMGKVDSQVHTFRGKLWEQHGSFYTFPAG